MAEEIVKKKVSELPDATSLSGLHTLGVNASNQSVKVSLEFVKNAADNADNAAASANSAASAANSAANNAATATTAANNAADLANSAAASANTAAAAATTAAGDANNATSAATTAAGDANNAASAAILAAGDANVAANNANTAADEVRAEVDDIKKFVYSRNMYGVEFLKGVSDPQSVRWIGGEQFQNDHFILKKFKVAKVVDGEVVGFLHQANWLKMEDGSPSNIIIDGETVLDDGSDIMLVNTEGFWILAGGTNETYERRLVSDAPFNYDGDESVYVKPYGVCVDYSIVKDGKQRSIRDNSHVGTGASGIGGISYLADGKGCPTSYVSRFNCELYARAKNSDNTKNTPYANAFQFDLNVWATLLFIQFKTKDLHSEALLGGGISSNDSAPDGLTWGTKTGVRVHETAGGYSYYNLNSSRFRNAAGGIIYNFYGLLNQYRPILKMFDAQLALSYASENGIAPNTVFSYDGFNWTYANIPGMEGLEDGVMNARVRKFITVSFSGYDDINLIDVTNLSIDYCLDQPVVSGKIAGWGNIWQWVSGVEGVVDANNNNAYTIYQTDNVDDITTDTDVTPKNAGEIFDFENKYTIVGTVANGSGYRLRHFDNSVMGNLIGGGLHTGECAYNYYNSVAAEGKRERRGVLFGGHANYTSCALRFAYANNAPTHALTYIGGGFRVTLK
jgi:hypothetical protein